MNSAFLHRPLVKTVAFVAPLVGLTLIMASGERLNEDASCPGSLAFAKSQQVLEDRPGVVDVFDEGFRPLGNCRFAMNGYADVETGKGVSRQGFEVVVAFDPKTRQWQQTSLAMPH